MPRIAQSSIEAIKQQVNLVDVVSPYVQLKRAGRSWKGLSPFSQEKTPSFYVHPDRGFFKCFSSGKGGDLFSFVMEMENLEFTEAVEFIARKFNITLEYASGGPSREEVSLRKQLFELHEEAAAWFHGQLLEGEEAAPVRSYWTEERGFSLETAKEFGIGYAPAAVNALATRLASKGASPEALHGSGLFFARPNERDPNYFKSRFRGRLMIPIRDVQGRVIAFTARKLAQTPSDDPAAEAKYVNSPETQIFHKGRVLFGLDHARTHLAEGGSFLLVEGQLDAVRCWSVGLHTTVAPQGTAITDEQLHLLRRYEPAVVECLLDGDEAGRKAALRALPLAFKAGLEFRFLLLPEKMDPDTLIREGGAAALDSLRKDSKSAIELAVSSHLPADRPPTTHEKTKALEGVFELLHHISSEVAREDYVQAAARLIGVDPIAALRDFARAEQRATRVGTTGATPESGPAPAQDRLLTRAESDLLWLLLNFPEFGCPVAETIDDDWIDSSSTTGLILRRLLAEFREGLFEDASQIENLVEGPEDRSLIADLQSRDIPIDEPKKQIESCLRTLHRNHLTAKINELEQKLANATPSSEDELALMRERKALRNSLSHQPQLPV